MATIDQISIPMGLGREPVRIGRMLNVGEGFTIVLPGWFVDSLSESSGNPDMAWAVPMPEAAMFVEACRKMLSADAEAEA